MARRQLRRIVQACIGAVLLLTSTGALAAEDEAATEKAPAPKPKAAPIIVTREPPAEFRGPDVTLIASEERMVYEYRQNGQLRMIKVVPKFGRPYYLVPHDRTRGFGDLEQAQTLVAEWVLKEF